jgi:hypothetical protein
MASGVYIEPRQQKLGRLPMKAVLLALLQSYSFDMFSNAGPSKKRRI